MTSETTIRFITEVIESARCSGETTLSLQYKNITEIPVLSLLFPIWE